MVAPSIPQNGRFLPAQLEPHNLDNVLSSEKPAKESKMSKSRKQYSPDFKAKAGIDSIRDCDSVAELLDRHVFHLGW